MTATGIGAAVRRKEDQRFITGKGHCTDDITRPGQTCACFVRSPHAHARIIAMPATPQTVWAAIQKATPTPKAA